ncbi:hypothetical protein DN752_03230 [Echinicola strongylocentroti]|uniref:Uncharacterized protein n=1 Tax=Echinicola strongylocentroti TaxID=1795355 RepID=A0A2Z4IDU0_9BACT|nr:hypothetical protein [Echinicola strongylocentroti]AWW29231.1 hypothetical protein DN752_03230 [Echinicola strongylocentroti]
MYIHLIHIRSFLLCIASLFLSAQLSAQQEAFIYGEVELRDETKLEGKITWSAGQSLWVDLLVAEKKDNNILDHLAKDDIIHLSEGKKKTEWGFMALWKNQYPSRKLTFRTQFGNLLEIMVTGDSDATIVLKNHENIRIFINGDKEYARQLGETITVQLSDGEKKKLPWKAIERIRFSNTPTDLANFKSLPLYGHITTRMGYAYQGLIKWDLEEHLSDQYLDGTTIDDRRARYHFYEVKSIRPKNKGSLIQLQSNKEIYLHELTNVTNENAGIQVRNPHWGQIALQWGDFKTAEFTPYSEIAGFGYNDFGAPSALQGTVVLKDDRHISGSIYYDLDEHWNIETLDGWAQGGGLRQIPFSLIKTLYPVSETHTAVILMDGEKIILGERSDVDQTNWGTMIKAPNGQFTYIPWQKLQSITFEH